MHTWTIYEPSWWKDFMLSLNHIISSNWLLFDIISICTDAVVFLFPIILLWLYLYGYKNKLDIYKNGSIKVMSWVVIAMIITIIIQQFVRKDRPESLPWLDLILAHVPTVSFPSDHATVGLAVSVWILLLGISIKKYLSNKKIYNIWIVLIILSLLMVLSRVAVAIHWTTDVLVGAIIWTIWAYIAYRRDLINKVSSFIVNMIDKVLSIFWKIKIN